MNFDNDNENGRIKNKILSDIFSIFDENGGDIFKKFFVLPISICFLIHVLSRFVHSEGRGKKCPDGYIKYYDGCIELGESLKPDLLNSYYEEVKSLFINEGGNIEYNFTREQLLSILVSKKEFYIDNRDGFIYQRKFRFF